jgi:stage II sporulation protein AA (anti-sigma F factor antagonist)
MEYLTLSFAGDVLTVKLRNEIDDHIAAGVREKIDEKMYALLPRAIVFDLSEVGFMDSSGLGLVLGRYTKARELGIEVSIKNPTRRTEKIFRMAGTDKFIKIIYDKEKKR